jgi:putative membrane protein
MKAILLAAAAAILVTGCTTTDEEEMAGPPIAEPMAMPAPEYVDNAASGDRFEIRSSELALQHSCDPYVRDFARVLIADHSRMSQQMMAAAQAANVPPPPMGLSPHHQDMLGRLQAAPPNSFDLAFREAQLIAHQEALEIHSDYAEDGDVDALRAVASDAVPVIRMHLDRVGTLPTGTRCTPPTDVEQRKLGQRG